MKTSCSIYKVTNLVNQKVYIGMSTQPKTRWVQHVSHANRGGKQALACAIRKHGADAFKFQVLFTEHGDDAVEKCCDAEMLLIEMQGTLAPNGYNLTAGGDGATGYVYSEEDKANMSLRQKRMWASEGYAENFKEKAAEKWQDETYRQKMTRINAEVQARPEVKAKRAESLRKHFSDPSARAAQAVRTAKHFESADARDATSKATKLAWEKNRSAFAAQFTAVVCVEAGKAFDSQSAAVKWLRENGHPRAAQSAISKVCFGKSKTAYGFKWKFLKEE